MIVYNEEPKEELEEEKTEEEGLPFGIVDEAEPLVGLVGEITEASVQQLALMFLSFNGGGILRPAEPEEDEEDIEFFISSSGGQVSDARLMIHHCSGAIGGTVPTVRSSFQEFSKVEEMMVEALAECTSMSISEIYNILSRNTDEYFSAEEALEMGIVDKII